MPQTGSQTFFASAGNASAKQLFYVTLPFTGAATGNGTSQVSGSAPGWTFTTPAGVTELLLWGRGGGGGGGGGGTSTGGGGMGGGGACSVYRPVTVLASTSYSVTIGDGGAGGSGTNTTSANDGSAGGTTSFDTALFQGGQAGRGGSSADPSYQDQFFYGYGTGGGGRGGFGGTVASSVPDRRAQGSSYADGGSQGSGGAGHGGGGGAGDGAGGNGGGSASSPGGSGTSGGGGAGGNTPLIPGTGGNGGKAGPGSLTILWWA